MSRLTERLTQSYWPYIQDRDSAITAGKQGAWASFICAGASALLSLLGARHVVILGLVGFNVWNLIDAFLFAMLGFWTWRMSRTFAVAALCLAMWERIDFAVKHGVQGSGIALTLILAIWFVTGVRGTFAFHKYNAAEVPSAPEV